MSHSDALLLWRLVAQLQALSLRGRPMWPPSLSLQPLRGVAQKHPASPASDRVPAEAQRVDGLLDIPPLW